MSGPAPVALLILSIVLMACKPVTMPPVAGYLVHVDSTSDVPTRMVTREARRLCRTRGQRAHFLESHPPAGSRFLYSHAFVCVDPNALYPYPDAVLRIE